MVSGYPLRTLAREPLEPMSNRHSDVAFVAIRLLAADGSDVYLMREHESWGDLSFVGGHVEPNEGADFLKAAEREASEEMEPLRAGVDFEIVQNPIACGSWGPVPSR